MPALANARHEKFAQELVKGATTSDACRAVGIDPRNGTRLMKNDEILRRVGELQERAAANVVISREWVLEQLIDNAAQAKQQGDIGPSNQALQLIGKEIGMFVDRSENVNINHDVSDEPFTEEEWAAENTVQ
jgi:phage terminase small subunit